MIREDQGMEWTEESSYDKAVVPFIFKDIVCVSINRWD